MTNLYILLQAQSGNQFMIMMGLMLIVMYFFMIRPQQKKAKAQKAFIESLKKGDKIITTGGIHGKIVSLEATTAVIESESYKLKIERSAISSELSAPLNKLEEAKVVETKA
ncbi:MAG: preprotein translocase subunit YajC [bacterium]|nr:preprotein translocase subunit YajC [bacterium]